MQLLLRSASSRYATGSMLMLREAFKRIGQPEGRTPPTARRALHNRLRWRLDQAASHHPGGASSSVCRGVAHLLALQALLPPVAKS